MVGRIVSAPRLHVQARGASVTRDGARRGGARLGANEPASDGAPVGVVGGRRKLAAQIIGGVVEELGRRRAAPSPAQIASAARATRKMQLDGEIRAARAASSKTESGASVFATAGVGQTPVE